jgi:glyceraldehyde 3-phosphate dehydrogenase
LTIRIAINGFGRIGRAVLRIGFDHPELEFVHINDLASPEMLAHLLAFDSVLGRYGRKVETCEGGFRVDGSFIAVSAEADPSRLPWAAEGIDVVVEATGLFTKRDKAMRHIEAGARKVIISAPATEPDATIVVGVNDSQLSPEHRIISNASCTTNCLAPVARVLNDVYGIERGLMTTIHSYTMDQMLLDAPHRKGDFRRARAAAVNMVPTSTGAAKAVGLVLPELKGKLNGFAIRVPTPNVSVVDLTFTSLRPMTVEGINAALTEAAQGPLRGILEASTLPLVSGDLIGNPASSIADLPLTTVLGENMAKVISWYDNEWGFSNRMIDLILLAMGQQVRR